MKTYSRVYAKIDLDAITSNLEELKNNLNANIKMMAIIKADGYGHGAVKIAEMLENVDYIYGFGVATLDEAILLRMKGIHKPILVLGCVFPDQYKDMLKYEIRANVYTEEMAEAISKMAVEEDLTAYVHIKLDTGMTRLGFRVGEESVDAIERIAKMDHMCMEGIFTHMARADEKDKTFTNKQVQDFVWMTEQLKKRNVTFVYEHCANSAAIIDVPEANFDLVRVGISMYGLYPSEDVNKENVKLKPALELKSQVIYVQNIPAGIPISYGGMFVSEREMKVATIPVGYADGYPRKLSNIGYVLIRGKKAPILGRVCMDQFMVDVTEIEGVSFGDAVTLIGKDGNEEIAVEELSELSGRFNYEFVCDIGKRVPRVFVKEGKITEQVDYFV